MGRCVVSLRHQAGAKRALPAMLTAPLEHPSIETTPLDKKYQGGIEMKSYTNMFDNAEKTLEGKVVVRLHPNALPRKDGKKAYYARVVRTTADDAAVATEMVKHTDLVRFNDMTPVMTAFVSSVKTLLAQGNAVRVSGLGTFYLRSPGAILTPTPSVADLGELTIGFSTDVKLPLVVKDTEVSAIVDADTSPAFATVTNMDTMETDGTITPEKCITITGQRLRLAGKASDNCGLYFAPQAAGGTGYDADESKWKRVADSEVYKNNPTNLLVRVPDSLAAGSWYIVVRTKSPASGVAKDDKGLLKTPRFGVCEFACTVM